MPGFGGATIASVLLAHVPAPSSFPEGPTIRALAASSTLRSLTSAG